MPSNLLVVQINADKNYILYIFHSIRFDAKLNPWGLDGNIFMLASLFFVRDAPPIQLLSINMVSMMFHIAFDSENTVNQQGENVDHHFASVISSSFWSQLSLSDSKRSGTR